MNSIEKATEHDLVAVKELNSLLKLDVKNFYWDSEDYIRPAINEERCFVIKEGNEVRASMTLEQSEPDPGSTRESLSIGVLIVHADFRKDGLGTELVEFAKSMAFKENKRLYVESFFRYRQLNYYKKLGFMEGGPLEYNGMPYHVLYIDPASIPSFPEMKRVSIGNRLEYISYLKKMPVVPSDVTFENIFAFDSPSRQINLSLINDNIVVLTRRDNKFSFYPVVGTSRLDETMLQCLGWLNKKDRDGAFTCVPGTVIDRIQPETLSKLRITRDRNNFDYLYDPDLHFSFSGSGLRTQRQNLSRFMEKNPLFKIITPDRIKEAIAFEDYWMNDYVLRMKNSGSAVPDIIIKENQAIKKGLSFAGSLALRIGGIYLDGVIKGFSIAEIFNKTGYIHFEKATREKGVYQALIHLFGQSVLKKEINLVNREQDLGIPGLRTSKTRYNPSGFIEKYNVTLR